jgi:hypothetical protein
VDPRAEAEPLFVPDGIARIELTLSQAAQEQLGIDPYVYVHGDLAVQVSGGRSFTLPDIGVRLKGRYGSFRTLDQKAAFLLKLNKFQAGQDLLGLKKLALNNMVQDPSMVHEQLAYALFRAANVPAPRTSYARVFVNDALYGLYATVEVLDNDQFLKGWYGDDTGNLYEGAYGSDLEPGSIESFDQDRGQDVALADLFQLSNTLDGISAPTNFVTEVSVALDLERYLEFAATEVFVGHWDGYAWTRNNYHLYKAPESRWTFMPWGLDQTFSEYLSPFGGDGRIQRLCAASQPCRTQLAATFERVSARVTELGLVKEVDAIRTMIHDAVVEDPRKEYDADTAFLSMEATQDFLRNRPADISAGLACTDPTQVDGDNDGAPGCGEDCDDSDPGVYPGAPEACNFRDDNCNGLLDDDPRCPKCVETPASGGGRYAFCFEARTYADAETDCVTQGGSLARIPSQTAHDEIRDGAFAVLAADFWIGLTDRAEEGTFVWTDGSPLTFSAWNDGEPNNWGDGEDCVHLGVWAGGRWNDMACETAMAYVCALP